MRLAPLLAVLPLAACLDGEVTLDFTSETEAVTTARIEVARDVFEMMGRDPGDACRGGEGVIEGERFVCTQVRAQTVEDLIARALDGRGDDLGRIAKVERIDEDSLRVSLDLGDLSLPAEAGDLGDLGPLAALMRGNLAGHEIVFRVRAARIEATTGTLSEDGREATWAVPLTAILDPSRRPDGAFVTTVDVDGCFLWVFC
jgi:hypothetical protein